MTTYHHGEDSFATGRTNDLEKQRFFDLALNEENEVNTLLAYYRNRIGRFDNEREDWLDKYNKLRTTQDEAHRQSWELQKRNQETAELRRILEEEKLRLYEERQGVVDLIKENDQLKLKELEDRKKISELTALGGSVDQEIVFYKDVKPETITRYGKTDLSLKSNLDNYENALKNRTEKNVTQKTTVASKSGKGVVKTIYLPNEQLNTVAVENDEIRRQLEENRQNYMIEIERLRDELRQRENELLKSHEDTQEKIRAYIDSNYRLQKDNIAFAKDYYDIILESNDVEKKLQEQNQVLRLKNAALANKFRIQQEQANSEHLKTTKTLDKTSDKFTAQYRQEIKKKDEEISLIKDQHKTLQQIYIQKIRELEENLTKLSKKYTLVEKRRLLENDGFRTDVRKLKALISEYQRFLDKKGPFGKGETDPNFEEEREEEEEARHAAKSELNLIQKQLNELENQLERARKMKS